MAIRAIPTTYSGQLFRSQLEADWAATFDHYNIKWIYEPEAYRLDNLDYLPDFYLPEIRFWAEAKGPLNQRLEKAVEFQKALDAYHVLDFDDEWEFERQHLVILRPQEHGDCVWEAAAGGRHITLVRCPACLRLGFMDNSVEGCCRYEDCGARGPQFWDAAGGDQFFSRSDTTLLSGRYRAFVRAPRLYGRGA